MHEVMRNAYSILFGSLERIRLLEGPRNRWKDNIKLDVTEVGCEGIIRIHLSRDMDHFLVL
jgi:hypothetical protein